MIGYDLGKADPEVLGALRIRRKGQLIWSQTLSWANDFPVTPDIITFYHKENLSPWASGRYTVSDTGLIEKMPAVKGNPISICRQFKTRVSQFDFKGLDEELSSMIDLLGPFRELEEREKYFSIPPH